MIAVFLAEGFEETEALTTVDILRRAGLDTVTIGIGGKTVTGSHGIPVVADREESAFSMEELKGIVLPGGMPGTKHLEACETVQKALDYAAAHGLLIAAICAAPSILGHKGLLSGRHATCFPGFEEDLTGAQVETTPAVTDGTIVTGKGMGATIPFALEIVRQFYPAEKVSRLEESLQCR